MARIKYYYDTETCKYERIKVRPQDVIWNVMGMISLILVSSIGIVFLFFSYFESPKEVRLQNEVTELRLFIESMQKEIDQKHDVLAAIEERDDNLYRVVLGAEPIDTEIRNAGIGGANRYSELLNKDLDSKDIMIKLKEDVDKLRRKMYIQSKSHDEIAAMAKNKEQLYAAIPAIQPVSNKELIRLASGFGYRLHPIYKVRKKHPGIDFSAPLGTPIYATADGVVSKAQVRFSGYGKELVINHGFGYETRYAHMQEFEVKKGQKVKRGQIIGYVGNTGTSTAPHLHYEVIKNGEKINPIHYFFNDLNPEEYEKIIELASIENQSLGM